MYLLISRNAVLLLAISTSGDAPQRAARLHGAVDACFTGQAHTPTDAFLRDRDHDRLRILLGEEVFDALYLEGAILDSIDAVTTYLRDGCP